MAEQLLGSFIIHARFVQGGRVAVPVTPVRFW